VEVASGEGVSSTRASARKRASGAENRMSNRGLGTSSSFVALPIVTLAIVALAGCQKPQGQTNGPERATPPEVIKPWGQMGAHRFNELRWQQGSDTFEGVEIAVVGEDPASGSMAMYVKVPPMQ